MKSDSIWDDQSAIEDLGSRNTPEGIAREIELRRAAYNSAKSSGLRSLQYGRLDEALNWFYLASRVLGYYHFGLWKDDVLDQALSQIANTLGPNDSPLDTVSKGNRRVVHLASYLMDYGGHTEMILNWSRCLADVDSLEQYFVSSECPYTRKTSLELGPKKLNELRNFTIDCRLCPQALQPFRRVQWLYNELRDIRPDIVILHVHPDDVFSLCAAKAAQTRLGVRIVYFNMADHLPNVGMAWADYVADFRNEGARYTQWLRGVPPGKILRVPLWSRQRHSPRLTRDELGIPDLATVSTTITTYYKIRPDSQWNFGKVIYDLLVSEPTHYHLVVGAGSDSERDHMFALFKAAHTDISRRLILLDQRADVDAIIAISDFLIESFPVAGGVVRLDAMSEGVPIIGTHSLQWPLYSDVDNIPENYPFIGTCNEDILRFSKLLIADKELRNYWSKILLNHYQQYYSKTPLQLSLGNLLANKPAPGFPVDLQPPVFDLEYAVSKTVAAFLDPKALRQHANDCLGYPPPSFARKMASRIWRALPLSKETRRRIKALLKS